MIQNSKTLTFLAATFGAAWLIWLGAYLNFAPNPALLIMPGTAVPSLMGLVFTVKYGGKAELKELLRAAVRFRAPVIWWLYTVLLFPGVLLLACAVLAVAGISIPPPQFPIWFLPIAFIYIFACLGPLGEELGWRGFLLKRFLVKWSVEKSGLLLGLIWSAWHLPLFFISGTIQHEVASIGIFIALAGYFIYTVCISLLMSLLYVRTAGNLLLCMVFHTICNLSLGVAPIILTKMGGAVLLSILLFTTAFIIKGTKNGQKSKF